ncbi:MAG TPA: PorV/PorQ family protein [bacterium]|nr:PorV/PorQ family protein [bacterium]
MDKRVLIIAVVILSFIGGQVIAQDFAPVGTAVAQFLEIGIGARATALGEAYTSLANDAGSAFWNPAGLAAVQQRSFYTAFTSWPAEISIGGFAFAMNFGNIGTFAISSTYLMTGDMEITTIANPEGTGEMFGISNFAVGLSYARYMTDHLAIGITTKLVREKYFDSGYYSWALDLGTIYHTHFHGLTLGMSILHFAPEVRFSGDYIDYSDKRSLDVNKPKNFETYSLPINFRFGVSFDLLNTEKNKITTSVDMIHPNNNLEQYNFGIEYCFNKMFFFRSGYRFNTDEGGFALGTGLKFNLFGSELAALDYSFTDLGVLKYIHRVSLGFSF